MNFSLVTYHFKTQGKPSLPVIHEVARNWPSGNLLHDFGVEKLPPFGSLMHNKPKYSILTLIAAHW